jgi:hypothetical protein
MLGVDDSAANARRYLLEVGEVFQQSLDEVGGRFSLGSCRRDRAKLTGPVAKIDLSQGRL